jgi:hypothetical protein
MQAPATMAALRRLFKQTACWAVSVELVGQVNVPAHGRIQRASSRCCTVISDWTLHYQNKPQPSLQQLHLPPPDAQSGRRFISEAHAPIILTNLCLH